MKHEQVFVARHNVRRMAADGKGEKLVILWIPTGGYLLVNFNPLCFSRERGEKSPNVFFIDIAVELLTMEDLKQLLEDRPGEQNGSVALHLIDSGSRSGARRKRCAYKHIGVEDTAQSIALQNRIENLRGESAFLRFAPRLVEHLLEGGEVTCGELAQP